ncbi:hypothetical protein CK203_006028 [Vitis vinifera]|uniref:Transposase MuDR plant domain-containing protein n=1 Tax=Vitis vinifera TaxID=29760 RepID=A0A438K5W1_VITVI|nr:hypothetical protein CK203_006028 [Vitis vinifera]
MSFSLSFSCAFIPHVAHPKFNVLEEFDLDTIPLVLGSGHRDLESDSVILPYALRGSIYAIALLCALYGEKCQASFDPISNRIQIFRGFFRFEWTMCTRNAWDTDEFSSCESLYVVADRGQHYGVGKPWYCINQTMGQVYSFMSVFIVTPNDYSVATSGGEVSCGEDVTEIPVKTDVEDQVYMAEMLMQGKVPAMLAADRCAINPHRGCRPVLSIEERASLTIRLMDATNRIYCYIFVGGKLVQKNDGQWEYLGGRSKGIHIYKGMAFEDFTKKIIEKFDISLDVMKMHYTLKFNPRVIQDLEDEDDLDNVVSHSDDFANVYLVDLPSMEAIEAISRIHSWHFDPPITFPSSNASCDPIPNTMMLSRGFASRSADTEYIPLELIRFRGRFEYKYKKNSPTHMSVKCSVDGCPWKITAHVVEGNVILRVHTYQVNHNHIAQDECSSKVKVSSKRGAVVVEDVFRTTPDYLPRQICKDFERDHGVQLTYNQAWHLKEKAKERIFGVPRDSYTFLPWLCHRLREINPGTIAEYTSQEGHFMQLFIAHAFSIQGFIMGCRPVLAIDSCHLSGPYKGALLSAIAYNADDGMFLLALGVIDIRESCVVFPSCLGQEIMRIVIDM